MKQIRPCSRIFCGGVLVAVLVVGFAVYQFGARRDTVGYNSLLSGDVAILMEAGRARAATLQARRDEKDFILRRDLQYLARHKEDIDSLKAGLADIAGIMRRAGDNQGADGAAAIVKLVDIYRQNFVSLVEAQTGAGLDQNSGRQGEFRRAAHRLQALMPLYDIDDIYASFWAMRRHENDYCRLNSIRNKVKFRQAVKGFSDLVSSRPFEAGARGQTLAALAEYQRAMAGFMDSAAADKPAILHHDEMGRAADKMEAAINSVRVPGATALLLAIRRHEKDFILRRDGKYADLVQQSIAALNAAFTRAGVLAKHGAVIKKELDTYSRSFTALVAAYAEIDKAEGRMRQVAHQIETQVDNIYAEALRGAAADDSSQRQEASSLLRTAVIAIIAIIFLAALVAFILTRSLNRPSDPGDNSP